MIPSCCHCPLISITFYAYYKLFPLLHFFSILSYFLPLISIYSPYHLIRTHIYSVTQREQISNQWLQYFPFVYFCSEQKAFCTSEINDGKTSPISPSLSETHANPQLTDR